MARPPTISRTDILDAALQVLRTDGERAMTQTRVAKTAGIPQGHLTYYFPKKRDLVVGVASHFAEVTQTKMRAFFRERRGEPEVEREAAARPTLRRHPCGAEPDRPVGKDEAEANRSADS